MCMNHNPLDSPDYSFRHAHSWDKTLNHLFEHRCFDPSGSDTSVVKLSVKTTPTIPCNIFCFEFKT